MSYIESINHFFFSKLETRHFAKSDILQSSYCFRTEKWNRNVLQPIKGLYGTGSFELGPSYKISDPVLQKKNWTSTLVCVCAKFFYCKVLHIYHLLIYMMFITSTASVCSTLRVQCRSK